MMLLSLKLKEIYAKAFLRNTPVKHCLVKNRRLGLVRMLGLGRRFGHVMFTAISSITFPAENRWWLVKYTCKLNTVV